MGRRTARKLLLALSAALLLSACPTVDLSDFGPGGSGERDGTAVGPIAGFGGLRVAGTEFTDNASAAVVDDRGRGVASLREGMTVSVLGTVGGTFLSGGMSEVTIEREVRGPVDDNGVELDNAAVRVLGQRVLATPAASVVNAFGNEIPLSTLKTLLDNGFRSGLEVHGAVLDNGVVHASYIGIVQDNAVADGNAELRGTIREFDGVTRTFRIGGQQVNFTDLPAGGRIGWPASGLANGQVVDVRGRIDAVGGGGVLRTDRTADRIQVFDVSLGISGDRAALEGYVTAGIPSSFTMTVPGGTVTVNGAAAAAGESFGVGKKVRVRGTVSGSGGDIVNASSVTVLPSHDVVLQGNPGGVPATGDTFTLLGKTVETDGYTIFRDAAGGVRNGFGPGSLAAGDTVRAIGWFDNAVAPGKVVAARVDRLTGAAGRVNLQAPALPVGATSLSILGVTVTTDETNTAFFDRGGVAFESRAAFFQRLVNIGPGAIVQVRNGVFVSASNRIDPPAGGIAMEIEIIPVNR